MALTPEEQAELQRLEMRRSMALQQRQALTHRGRPDVAEKTESEEFRAGRQMPRPAQTALRIANALSLGTLPKITPPKTSEIVQGATTQFGEDYPKTAFGLDVAGAMLPGAVGISAGRSVLSAGAREAAEAGRAPLPVVDMSGGRRIGTAGISGGVEGGVSAYGQSDAETKEQLLKDILYGGVFGAASGGAAAGATGIAGGVTRTAAEQVSEKAALSEAQKRLIQALLRDMPEGQDFASITAARMRALGPEGAVLDTGENVRQMADLLATLPGRAKGELQEFVEQRAMRRGERMTQAAQEGLQTGGKRLAPTLDALEIQRMQQASPLYQRLDSLFVTDPSGTMAQLVQRAEELGATSVAREIAQNQRVSANRKGWTLDEDIKSGTFNAADLARIKEGLDSLIQKEKDPVTGRYSPLGRSRIELQNKLKNELIRLTVDPQTKESVYRQALDAYAGPSAMKDAAEYGNTVLNRSVSADELRKELAAMSESERQAAMIGAFEAIRTKVGTSKAGRTEMLNIVENFVPREKLEVLFGSPEKFQQFYRTMVAERTMREADALGLGSQTMPRQAALGELNADVVLDISEMASGGPAAWLSRGTRMWNQAQMPEKTRNELARLLMMRGQPAEGDLFAMENIARQLAQRRAQRAAVIGGAGSGATGEFTQQR